MARVFAYLMEPEAEMTDQAIFTDVSETIGRSLKEVYDTHSSLTGISNSALSLALNKLLKNVHV